MSRSDPVLRRTGGAAPLHAVGGEGAQIIDSEGNRWLDACSGVFVAILGANPPGVAAEIASAMERLQFAYSGRFGSAEEDRLAEMLVEKAPEGFGKLWLSTSGSAANEAAVKLARQYHLARGNAEKTAVITRWHSYHGNTALAMSLSGSGPRRRPFQPYLNDFPHVLPPDPDRRPGTAESFADEVEHEILARGAQYISAVMVEPVAGAPLGALIPPDGYLRRLREICDRHDVLLIADEIVSGLGRTGRFFAVEHEGVVPDMITLAKGLGGGFTPIGAVLAHGRVTDALESARQPFMHGESFTGHRLMGAAGVAVLDFIDRHGLVQRVAEDGPGLQARLAPLEDHPLVGRLRGRGFLWGLELVAEKDGLWPFPRAAQVSERVVAAAAARGVIFQGGNAGTDGENGDMVTVAPPYVTTSGELDQIAGVLSLALDDVWEELSREGGRAIA